MNDDRLLSMVLLIGVLALAARALLARGSSARLIIGSLFSWGAIALVIFLGFTHRDQIDAVFASITGNEAQVVEGRTIRIRMSSDGHFWARVSLNGVERRMLIDSGATITAISSDTAAAADIKPRDFGAPVLIETANGTVNAKSANADTVAIGPLKTKDLHVVVADNFGEMNVIGMNFLSRLKSWRVENKELILEPANDSGDGARKRPVTDR